MPPEAILSMYPGRSSPSVLLRTRWVRFPNPVPCVKTCVTQTSSQAPDRGGPGMRDP
jgi:hypothetical protein